MQYFSALISHPCCLRQCVNTNYGRGKKKSPKSCDSDSPSWHKAFWQPRGTLAWLCPAPGSALQLLAATPIRPAPRRASGGPPLQEPRSPQLSSGGLKIETVLIRGSEGERGWLLLGYDTPHYVATALPEAPLLSLGYRARALRKDAN